MKLLIVTDSYPPELRSASQLMAELAEGLAENGHEVTVATTVPAYNLAPGTVAEEVPRDEVRRGVRVVRIATLPHHKVPYLVRGISQLLLPGVFARAVRRSIRGPFDAVIVHSPPLPLALAASRLAHRYGARFIPNIHDIFPQNGIDLVATWQKPLIQLFFGPMERTVYRRAETIVVPSALHARYLTDRRSVPAAKLRVIPHWIDTVPFDAAPVGNRFRTAWGLANDFVFLFAGVLGPSQGLDLVLDAAESFRAVPRVKFLFVGDGTDRARLEGVARERKLENVIFKPFVSSAEYPELVKAMSVGIATLTSKNTTPAVPAKLMGYMAAGVPVVVAVHTESDALRIVREAECGFAAVSDDRTAVVAAFRAAYDARATLPALGANGYRYLTTHFSKKVGIAAWERVLAEGRGERQPA
ncbi:MAG: glycosyltransferase family 4 protein [bacterium]|nr:glycosyltransferase family 4 protein [bacterium]